jgi:hypothetical protein
MNTNARWSIPIAILGVSAAGAHAANIGGLTSVSTSTRPISASSFRGTEVVVPKNTGNITNDPAPMINDPAPFTADINGDGIYDVADFVAFQDLFNRGHMAANCDGSITPPVLNFNDFTCFLQTFAAGQAAQGRDKAANAILQATPITN